MSVCADNRTENASGRREQLRSSDLFATVLAMAVHDLRQPLRVILGTHELLARQLTASPEREQLECGDRATAQLSQRLDLLMEALHLHQTPGGIQPKMVRLGPILQSLGRELGQAARRRRLDLRILPTRATVMSQALLLSEILRNLARNALQYTPAGGRVLVGCRRRGNTVHIGVHDTGVGVPTDKLACLFEAFQRLDSTRPDGLGLFIVGRAAASLGHLVAVRSAVGHGSCFTVIADAAEPR